MRICHNCQKLTETCNIFMANDESYQCSQYTFYSMSSQLTKPVHNLQGAFLRRYNSMYISPKNVQLKNRLFLKWPYVFDLYKTNQFKSYFIMFFSNNLYHLSFSTKKGNFLIGVRKNENMPHFNFFQKSLNNWLENIS